MEQRLCKKPYPASALKLYIKLFSKRRKSSKFKMIEAIKSWISLDKIEREQFFIKYKECQINHKKKLADYLSKTKPFLKKKEPSRNRAVRNVSTKQESDIMEMDNDQINNVETINNDQITETQSIDDNSQFLSEKDLPEKTHSDFYERSDTPKNYHSFVAQPLNGVLAEPAPPSVICSKDLFEMIKSRNRESIDVWSSLSKTQKSRYRKAVFLLKEEYIRKFKAYLESLPAKQLFNYYNNFN